MRKSTLFISVILTTFVLAMLVGVASAYQYVVGNNLAQSQTQVNSVSQRAVLNIVAPEDAAALAAQVIGRDDLYSVEVTDLDNETVFLVTFSSGDLVYISLDGQVRSIGKIEIETVIAMNYGGESYDYDDDEEYDDASDGRRPPSLYAKTRNLQALMGPPPALAH